jgi:hypothetical protein
MKSRFVWPSILAYVHNLDDFLCFLVYLNNQNFDKMLGIKKHKKTQKTQKNTKIVLFNQVYILVMVIPCRKANNFFIWSSPSPIKW